MGPCYGLLCPTGLHMELGPKCAILADKSAKKCKIMIIVLFLALCFLFLSSYASALGF